MATIEETATGTVLSVDRSLTGRRWRLRAPDDSAVMALAQAEGLSETLARILAGRGVGPGQARSFLEPRLKDSLPALHSVADLERAAQRIANAIIAREPVCVFGDYDVDGATSSALFHRYFTSLGRRLRIYIPDRITEGYGPNMQAMQRLADEGIALVVTVDCGTMAHGPLAAARERGMDVVVVDHHQQGHELPPAFAIVNPNRRDDLSGAGMMAAAGVSFLVLAAVSRALRDSGFFAREGLAEPDLFGFLDLVALGTVCDVVPLTGPNRALVAQGLRIARQRMGPGLSHLAAIARITGDVGCYHLGFLLGPRINAGGRVGTPDLGVRLLTTDDAAEAEALSAHLDALNRERQALEGIVLDQAMEQATRQANRAVLVVAQEGWHPGVIGIVAGRLKERFHKPALVIGVNSGIGKGSGRSVSGVDLGAGVVAAADAGLLVNGGGHAMAAGLTVAPHQIDAFADFIEGRLEAAVRRAEESRSLALDGVLAPGGVTPGLADEIGRAAPFGPGNPEPVFALAGVRVLGAQIVGQDHVRCALAGGDGGRAGAIAFRCASSPLGEALLGTRGRTLHVAGRIKKDEWQGRAKADLVIEDAAFA